MGFTTLNPSYPLKSKGRRSWQSDPNSWMAGPSPAKAVIEPTSCAGSQTKGERKKSAERVILALRLQSALLEEAHKVAEAKSVALSTG
jgi:hypothetical protein